MSWSVTCGLARYSGGSNGVERVFDPIGDKRPVQMGFSVAKARLDWAVDVLVSAYLGFAAALLWWRWSGSE
jgi:hypothetical protein